MLPGTEQDRRDDDVQLVDQPDAKVLANRRDAATEANVAAARRGSCLIQGGTNTFSNEPELGVALHFDWSSCVVRQHKHRRVIRRLIAPPAFPAFVWPRAADRTEHVAPEN